MALLNTTIFRGSMLVATMIGGAAFAPTSAQAGFFEQIFGGQPTRQPPQEAPSYGYDQPASPSYDAPMQVQRPRKKVVLRDEKPNLQKTKPLMQDDTLVAGDAVMMKDGIHVYTGSESAKHSAKQFVRLDNAKVLSSKERTMLASMDEIHRASGEKVGATEVMQGRSVAQDGEAISKGFKITDARGQSVRYVGP